MAYLSDPFGSDSEDAELTFVLSVDRLLDSGSSWIRNWEDFSHQSGFPRPPRQLDGRRRLALLQHTLATERLGQPDYRDFPTQLSTRLETLLRLPVEELGRSRELEQWACPTLLHLCCTEAAFEAVRHPARARSLVMLARAIGEELNRKTGPSCSCTPDLFTAEVESAHAVVVTLEGRMDEGRRRLDRAESKLATRHRLLCWSRRDDGSLQPPRRVKMPLRSHALWLACSASVHIAHGHLDHALQTTRDAADLYFQSGHFFACGLQHRRLAQLQAWLGRPRRAAHEFESALQLLDLRREPELQGQFTLELALLQLQAGHIVRGSQELELARDASSSSSAVSASGIAAAQAFLFLRMDNPRAARLWLQRARIAASPEQREREDAAQLSPTTCVRGLPALTLDLVALEANLEWPRPDPARWLDDALSRQALETAPAALRRRWTQLRESVHTNRLDASTLRRLQADLERWRRYPNCPWRRIRAGSLWTQDAARPGARISLLTPTVLQSLPLS